MGGKHRKGHKTRKTRKARGGAGYGFGAPVTVGTLEVVPTSTSTPYSAASGKPIADPYATNGNSSTLMGGKRRTRKGKSKKSGKKSRKSRSRKMRGGAGVYNAGAVGTGFTGAVSGMPGSQTYGGYTGYAAKLPVGGPTAGADGVYRV
jgi:hypothetical protein